MGRVWWGALLVVGAFLVGGSSSALAEGRKSLEEVLFEKGVLTKDEAASVQGRKLAAWVDRLTFSGDMRLRQENFWKRNGNDDRSRQRFRLRLGTDLKLDTLTVGIRLASGTGEQVSTNKSFDNLSSQTALYLDRAFLKWQGEDTRWLTLTGGRMPNPFFTVYSSDIVWDDDYNPEGVAENFAWKLGGSDLFLTVAQIVLDEDSAGPPSTDQWLFGQQVGVKASPLTAVQTVLAVAYYNAVNTQNTTLSQGVVQDGNSRAASVLVNDYNVVAVTAQVATQIASLPVALMGDVVQNTADTKSAVTGGVDTKAGAYQAGLIVGKASDPRTWEAAYFYKKVGTDATLADVADSDFGDGGTNRKGHIGWVAYNPSKALQVKVKYFTTQLEDDTAATQKDVNRLQADLAVKF